MERSLLDLVKPQAKQLEFLTACADPRWEYLLYGGAAGGGKSYILRWLGILRLLKHFESTRARGIRIGLFCEDYPSLNDRHISKVRYEIPEWLGEMHEQSHEFRLRDEFGNGILAFRNLDDPAKYLSVEFADVLIDELTMNDKKIFTFLNMRRRWPGVHDSIFAGGTNPGGPGHAWVRKLWIERDFSGEDAHFDPEKFHFIQARAADNAEHLPAGYASQFVTDVDRRVYLEGDWDVFEGQYFPEFRRNLHVVDPFDVPEHWKRWRGVDYGTANPFCALWKTINPEDGTVYVYRELYARNLTAYEQGCFIREKSADEHIAWTAADPSMFNRTGVDGRSPEEEYRRAGVVLSRGYNNRVSGWNNVRERLRVRPETGYPGLRVFSSCVNLIRTLPLQMHDEHDPEDLDTDLEDHAVDALRYGLSPHSLASSKRSARSRGNRWSARAV